MIVKEGYKNTEVGVIPEDWEVKGIGDFCELTSSKRIFEHDYVSIGVPFYRGKEISMLLENKTITEPYYITESKYESLRRRWGAPIKGDVLITAVGTLCNVYLIPNNKRFYFKDGNLIWLRNISSVDFKFFVYQIGNFKKEIIDNAIGSSQKALTMVVLKKQLIPLPSTVFEQTAIATVLSDTDNLIQALEKKIAKKELIKKGAMQQLLEPKEGWERIKIDDAIDVYRGGSPRPIQDYITPLPFGVNWIKIGDTSSDGKYITHTKERIIPEGALYSRSVSKGDFLLSNSMSFGRPYILKIDGCIHDGWLVLQNYQATFDREFLYYTLISEDVLNQYLTKASGSGVLNLNKELVKTVELNRPKDVAEQTRIAQILSDMDTEIESLQEKLLKYRQLKQGLMQELLTGRIRLV